MTSIRWSIRWKKHWTNLVNWISCSMSCYEIENNNNNCSENNNNVWIPTVLPAVYERRTMDIDIYPLSMTTRLHDTIHSRQYPPPPMPPLHDQSIATTLPSIGKMCWYELRKEGLENVLFVWVVTSILGCVLLHHQVPTKHPLIASDTLSITHISLLPTPELTITTTTIIR